METGGVNLISTAVPTLCVVVVYPCRIWYVDGSSRPDGTAARLFARAARLDDQPPCHHRHFCPHARPRVAPPVCLGTMSSSGQSSKGRRPSISQAPVTRILMHWKDSSQSGAVSSRRRANCESSGDRVAWLTVHPPRYRAIARRARYVVAKPTTSTASKMVASAAACNCAITLLTLIPPGSHPM